MEQGGKKKKLREMMLQFLDKSPDGLRFSELAKLAQEQGPPGTNRNTIGACIRELPIHHADEVHKPAQGLYQLLKYADSAVPTTPSAPIPQLAMKAKESDFYVPFADWLVNDIEDATSAIPLGGNKFKDKWGTPDVIGKRQSGQADLVKGPTEIISAEIKTDTQQLVTAFGQACAYKLFSHRAYLVAPSHAHAEEMSRLDSLCQIFGIGLVTFNVNKPQEPDFRIRVRPARHEPDLFWTNKYVRAIADELFPNA